MQFKNIIIIYTCMYTYMRTHIYMSMSHVHDVRTYTYMYMYCAWYIGYILLAFLLPIHVQCSYMCRPASHLKKYK